MILLQDINDKAPSYVEEKWEIQNMDLRGAVQSLDLRNMQRLRSYLLFWEIHCPEADTILKEYGA